MVDAKKIQKIISERKKAHINDPDIEKKYWIPLLNALGEDEDDIIDYLESLEDDVASWFSEIYEEVIEKFPSDEMKKVFHRINNLRTVLHLIKDDEGLFRHYLLTACQHQILQDTVNIFCSFKELLIFLVLVKVEIGGIFIIVSAELFQNPSLTHLTYAFHN